MRSLLVSGGDPRLQFIGRFDGARADAPLMAWSGSEIRARFSGDRLVLRLEALRGPCWFTAEIDGTPHTLALVPGATQAWQPAGALAAGDHTLRLVKRTEGSMAEARFHGLELAPGASLLAPPPPRPLRFEFYGDSITAGACNGDAGEDQFDDASTHDGTRAYGALTAGRLDADYIGIALGGTGITRTWHDYLMPEVWDRVAPRPDAPRAPPPERAPDVVFVNLGQNDHGFPASRGEPFAADYGPRYLAFVRDLRARYPRARLVLLTGGMTGWKEQPALERTTRATAARLRAGGDALVWTFTFEAFAATHPRFDVHERMADELVAFLRRRVLS
jgi:lysophospholipase L1-like esterase